MKAIQDVVGDKWLQWGHRIAAMETRPAGWQKIRQLARRFASSRSERVRCCNGADGFRAGLHDFASCFQRLGGLASAPQLFLITRPLASVDSHQSCSQEDSLLLHTTGRTMPATLPSTTPSKILHHLKRSPQHVPGRSSDGPAWRCSLPRARTADPG